MPKSGDVLLFQSPAPCGAASRRRKREPKTVKYISSVRFHVQMGLIVEGDHIQVLVQKADPYLRSYVCIYIRHPFLA